MSRGKRSAIWIAGLLLIIGAQYSGLFWMRGPDMLPLLVAGWIPFLRRVGPQIQVRWDLVASSLAYATILVVGSHLFLRWLYREMRKRSEDAGGDADSAAMAWRWRWTLGGFAILFLMFAAGTAAVGITHQTTWLVRSPQPLYYRPPGFSELMLRSECLKNLERIGKALTEHAREHGGQLPDDLSVLVAEGRLEDDRVLKCPAEYESAPDRITYEQQAGEVAKPSHASFIYFGKGTSSAGPHDRVVVVEPLEFHDGMGINVLYANGHAEWLNAPEAERLLLTLGFERVESPPRR